MSAGLASLLPMLRVNDQRSLEWHIPGRERYIQMAKIPPRSWVGAATSEDTPHW